MNNVVDMNIDAFTGSAHLLNGKLGGRLLDALIQNATRANFSLIDLNTVRWNQVRLYFLFVDNIEIELKIDKEKRMMLYFFLDYQMTTRVLYL